MERYHDTPGRASDPGTRARTAHDGIPTCPDVLEGIHDEAPSDDGFDEADEAFEEAFDGDHNVEYWYWNGVRLIPASPDEAERFREREAQERLAELAAAEARRARHTRLWGVYKRALVRLGAGSQVIVHVFHFHGAAGGRGAK